MASSTPVKKNPAVAGVPSTSTQSSLMLDEGAVERAKSDLSDGAVTPSMSEHADAIVKLLNDSLATELVCVLRYKRHHYTAKGMSSPAIADEFMVHAQEETAHSEKIAARIVQLGGEPDFNPTTLLERSHAEYDESKDLKSMIRSNLIAERVAVEVYRQQIRLIGDKDPTTCQMLKEILADEEEHADELADLLDQ